MLGLVRKVSLGIPLALAVGVPYAMMSESTQSVRSAFSSVLDTWVTPGQDAAAVPGITDPAVARILGASNQIDAAVARTPATTIPTVQLEGLLRFDISPRWVIENWPYVATTRGDGGLDGLRVPVVTGTQPHDVAGSLTYYFDQQQQVQRIALDGVVGDERQLVAVVTRLFQLQAKPVPGISLFVATWNGKTTSALCIRRFPVLNADTARHQFEFALELNRPSNYFGLSNDFRARLQYAQASHGGTASVR